MNPLNYASLEASQRLHDAGIILETDMYHCPIGLKDGDRQNRKPENIVYELRQSSGRFACGLSSNYYKRCIPAPSMAEVWRELPESYQGTPISVHHNGIGDTYVWPHAAQKPFCSTNPTDALIYLKIWTVEQERKEKGK